MRLGVALIVVIMLIDYLTGPEVGSAVFYLIPIGLIAWFVGRDAGILMSILGAFAWLIADLLAGHSYSHQAILYWNAFMRLGFFIIIAIILSALRTIQAHQEELRQFIIHDLCSPLTNVMLGLQTMQDDENGKTTKKDAVEACSLSCQRMLILINSLLDLARFESGHMPLRMEQTSVEELVETSLKQVSMWAAQKRILLSRPKTDAEIVYADPKVTERVLVNLLSNAIKFSPSGSTVVVRVTASGEHEVAFSIVDQGQSIPQAWSAMVFDKFAQVDRQSGIASGSGVGLMFCRYAVEAQGGRIYVEGGANKGITLTFTLPRSAR